MAKVLVIDDSLTIRKAAESILRAEGHKVFTAENGFEAMSVVVDSQPDLIFVDIMMPRLDGYQTCKLIKLNRHCKDTPVILLSSKDSLFDRARGRIAGSQEHINKPFTKSELLAVLDRFH